MSDDKQQRLANEVARLVAEADQRYEEVKAEIEYLRGERRNAEVYIAALEQMNVKLRAQLDEANNQIAEFGEDTQ